MEKSILKSKTFWGFGVALLLVGLQSAGLIESTAITELLKYTGGIVGVWGARDALN